MLTTTRALLALTLLSGAMARAADAPRTEQAMRKQDFVAPLFADGPRVDASDFEAWLATQGPVRLPFTIWRNPERVGAIGVLEARPEKVLRLSDGALGVPLDERLRQLCGDGEPCRVWLAGKLGESMPLPDPDPSTIFNVHAVHERVEGQGPHRAQSIRGPACLAIRTLPASHCARGPQRCAQCKAAAAQPPLPRLLDLCPWGDAARPTVEIARDGKKSRAAYDVLRSFVDVAEARAFAARHRLTDVELR
jgi:hypothetical protein